MVPTDAPTDATFYVATQPLAATAPAAAASVAAVSFDRMRFTPQHVSELTAENQILFMLKACFMLLLQFGFGDTADCQ
jgi:hypothetical protein